jgi:pyruvate carboxylase
MSFNIYIFNKIISGLGLKPIDFQFPFAPAKHIENYKGKVKTPDVAVCIHRSQCARDFFIKAKELGINTLVGVETPGDKLAGTGHCSSANEAYDVNSYMDIDGILNMLESVSEKHHSKKIVVYPGYGFLSENANFRELLENKGKELNAKNGVTIAFMGPSAESMRLASNKLNFQNKTDGFDLPIIPGHKEELSVMGLKSIRDSGEKSTVRLKEVKVSSVKITAATSDEELNSIVNAKLKEPTEIKQYSLEDLQSIRNSCLENNSEFPINFEKAIDSNSQKFEITTSTTDEQLENIVEIFRNEGVRQNESTILVTKNGEAKDKSVDVDIIGLKAIADLPEFAGKDLRVKATEAGGGSGQAVIKREWLDNLSNPDISKIVLEKVTIARAQGTEKFGSGQLMLQSNQTGNFRHVEMQIVADGTSTMFLAPRDCSWQAGDSKKFVEVLFDDPEGLKELELLKGKLSEFVKDVNYSGPGTIELLYNPDLPEGKRFLMLEMNTRVQVEHPVSEDATGYSVTALGLHVASGGKLANIESVHREINDTRAREKTDVIFCGQLRVNMESHGKDANSDNWLPIGTTGQDVFSYVDIPTTIPGVYVPGACIKTGQGIPSDGDSNVMRVEISVTQKEVESHLLENTDLTDSQETRRLVARELWNKKSQQFMLNANVVGPRLNFVALSNASDIVGNGTAINTDNARKTADVYTDKKSITSEEIYDYLIKNESYKQIENVEQAIQFLATNSTFDQQTLAKDAWVSTAQGYLDRNNYADIPTRDQLITRSDTVIIQKHITPSELKSFLINSKSEEHAAITDNVKADNYLKSLSVNIRQELVKAAWVEKQQTILETSGLNRSNSKFHTNAIDLIELRDTPFKTDKPRGLVTWLMNKHSELDGHLRYVLNGLNLLSAQDGTPATREFMLINPDTLKVPKSERPLKPVPPQLDETLEAPRLQGTLTDSNGNTVETPTGLLDILNLYGAKGLTRYMKDNRLTGIMSTTYRDNSQSVDANREHYADYECTLESTRKACPSVIQETAGGARPAVDILFKDEDHFRNIEDMNEKLQSVTCGLFRSTGISYYNQSIVALTQLYKEYFKAGLNMPRIFDATNSHPDAASNSDYPSLHKSTEAYAMAIKELKEEGFFKEGQAVPIMPMFSIAFTGALTSGDTIYNSAFYKKLVDQIMDTAQKNGLDPDEYMIDIKDMVGQANVADMQEIVRIIKEDCGFTGLIHTHMHNPQGNAAEVQAKSGADFVDAAFHTETEGIGQCSMTAMIDALKNEGRVMPQFFHDQHIGELSRYFQELINYYEAMQVPKEAYASFLGNLGARFFRIPGGQGTTYATQAMKNGFDLSDGHQGRVLGWAYVMADKLLADTPDFNNPFHRISLVTPTSQAASNLGLLLINGLSSADNDPRSVEYLQAETEALSMFQGITDCVSVPLQQLFQETKLNTDTLNNEINIFGDEIERLKATLTLLEESQFKVEKELKELGNQPSEESKRILKRMEIDGLIKMKEKFTSKLNPLEKDYKIKSQSYDEAIKGFTIALLEEKRSSEFLSAKNEALRILEGEVDLEKYDKLAVENGYSGILKSARRLKSEIIDLEATNTNTTNPELNKDIQELKNGYEKYVKEFTQIMLLQQKAISFQKVLRNLSSNEVETLLETNQRGKLARLLVPVKKLGLDKTVNDYIRGAMGISNPLGLPRYRAAVMRAYGLEGPKEVKFDLEEFKKTLIKKGISEKVLDEIHPGTLIAGAMLPEDNLANLLEKIQTYGQIRVGLDAWIGDIEVGQSFDIQTPSNQKYTIRILDIDPTINKETKKRMVKLSIDGKVMTVPITYVKFIPPIQQKGLATFGLGGEAGFIKRLEDSLTLGSFIKPGSTIGTKEVMKVETPLTLKANNFPDDAQEGGYIVPVRVGLASVLEKAREAKPNFTQTEAMTAKFKESQSSFAILSEEKFKKLFPDGYTEERAEIVAEELLDQLGRY